MSENPNENDIAENSTPTEARPKPIAPEQTEAKQVASAENDTAQVGADVVDASKNEDIQRVNTLLEENAKKQLEQARQAKLDVKDIPISKRRAEKRNLIQTSAMRDQPLEARGLTGEVSRTQELKSLQMGAYATTFDIAPVTPSTGARVKSIVFGVLAALIIFLAAIVGGGLAFGFKPYVVVSGSMEPDLPVGCMVIVKHVDPLTLKVGDDISYQKGNGVVITHRIGTVEINPNDLEHSYVTTYGINGSDASSASETVMLDEIIGKVFVAIPWVGGALYTMRDYFYIVIPAIIAVIVACILVSKLVANAKAKRKMEEGAAKQEEQTSELKEQLEERDADADLLKRE